MDCFYSQVLNQVTICMANRKETFSRAKQTNTQDITTINSTVYTVAYSARRFSKQPSSVTSFSFRGIYMIRRS